MTQALHPNPLVWPECSECKTPFVLRRCIAFTGNGLKGEWVWQRDCKHKKAEPAVVDKRPARAPRKAKA